MRASESQKTDGLKNHVRKLLSYSAWSGVVPAPGVFRPYGVSAMTLVKNEEDWVETSLLSIVDFVDEVVVADNGSVDETPKILSRLAKQEPRKIRLLDLCGAGFVNATNTIIGETKYRWLLRWHGDFVARTSGPFSIRKLTERIALLNPLKHYCIALSGVALDGDLEHQFLDRVDAPENFLYTFSPWLRYRSAGRWEELHVPWFYSKRTWRDAHYFHMRSVKSNVRLLQKVYQGHWFRARDSGSDISLEEFVLENARKDLGTSDLTEAAKRFVVSYFRDAVRFDRGTCGDYPDILLPALARPPFRLTFQDGRIVGRVESSRFRPQVSIEESQ